MDRLSGVIQHYDWGDLRALPDLLGREPSGQPQAEYWLGTHPRGPARLGSGPDGRSLAEELARRPGSLLGPVAAGRHDGLPFMLKVLAAARPLSIQAHPNPAQAAAGFAREEAAGIAADDRRRNFRDSSHKPELVCALTRFEIKCGLRDLENTRRLLERFGPTLSDLSDRLASSGPGSGADAELLGEAVAWLLHLPDGDGRDLARSTAARAGELAGGNGAGAGEAFASEIEWTTRIGAAFPGDVGVVVALLLNHVVLEPGQALFLPAGNLHAYLRGTAVELMANSDNIVRGGLTTKHVDVDQLLAIVDWTPGPAAVQHPDAPVHTFDVPAPEFGLTRLDSSLGQIDGVDFAPTGPEIVLVTAGAVALTTDTCRLDLDRGQAAFVWPFDGPYRVLDRARGRTLAWRATVGEPS